MLNQRRDHLRNHVARTGDDDLIALADVLAGQILLVVKRRLADGHAAHLDGLKLRERNHVADPTDVPDDPPQCGRGGHRRKLPGDRPARFPPDNAEFAPQGALVDLDDNPVDLVVEPLAPLLPPAAAIDDRLDPVVGLDLVLDREPPFAQPLDLVRMSRVIDAAAGADAVAPHRERSRGGDSRVELANGPCGGVARISEGGSPSAIALLVQRAKPLRGK